MGNMEWSLLAASLTLVLFRAGVLDQLPANRPGFLPLRTAALGIYATNPTACFRDFLDLVY